MANSPRVAVVVAGFERATLTADEQVSVRHLDRYLGRHDRFLLLPKGGRLRIPGVEPRFFPPRFFGSAKAHSHLVMWPKFYEAFAEYEFVLIYHLDALVLSDQLDEWARMEWDYIGAPWFLDANEPQKGFWGVGNGGFSLRRVRAMLELLRSKRLGIHPDEFWARRYMSRSLPERLLNLPRKYLKYHYRFNGLRREFERYADYEDIFLAFRAKHYMPEFRIAPVDVALRFAFEYAPEFCLEQTGGVLPFGCHYWPRFREFWRPHLVRETSPMKAEHSVEPNARAETSYIPSG